MFSYDAKVFPLTTELRFGNSSVKARASLVIDDTLEIQNFRVMETNGSLWVALPSVKANKPDENGKFRYYDEIRFIDPRAEGEKQSPRQREICQFILSKYMEAISSKSAAAKAQHKQGAPRARATSAQDAMSDIGWGGEDF